jgi:hypothetical protein
MSPTSETIELLAKRHGVSPTHALEYFLKRSAIREYDGGMTRSDAEEAALKDLEMWIQLDIRLNGDVGPQLKLKGAK